MAIGDNVATGCTALVLFKLTVHKG